MIVACNCNAQGQLQSDGTYTYSGHVRRKFLTNQPLTLQVSASHTGVCEWEKVWRGAVSVVLRVGMRGVGGCVGCEVVGVWGAGVRCGRAMTLSVLSPCAMLGCVGTSMV